MELTEELINRGLDRLEKRTWVIFLAISLVFNVVGVMLFLKQLEKNEGMQEKVSSADARTITAQEKTIGLQEQLIRDKDREIFQLNKEATQK